MFKYWTEDTLASNFRKMLTLEQHRNPEMANLLNGQLNSVASLVSLKRFNGRSFTRSECRRIGTRVFCANLHDDELPDQMDNKEHASDMVEKHIDYFMASIRDHSKATISQLSINHIMVRPKNMLSGRSATDADLII